MFYGNLEALDCQQGAFFMHPIWKDAFNWLSTRPLDQPAGIYKIRGESMYANVHGYETKTRRDCRYESHRRYLDLQYCISGGEIIEWHPLARLEATDSYDTEKDVIHHQSPPGPDAQLRMASGAFAVFFPSDGHMPKIADGVHPRVDKLVIKIDLGLFH
jgi:YhcH/YjgK/YiaL family protein